MPERELRGPGAQRTHAIGAMMLAGGALAGITVLLPPSAGNSEWLVVVVGAVAAVIGTIVLAARRELPGWVVGLIATLGTVLITLATYEGGSDMTGTADNEMLYVWVCLFSFYFLPVPAAVLQLVVVAGAYAWLLSVQGVGTDEAITRWLVTLSTLVVVGVLVARLRAHLDRFFDELADRTRLDSLTQALNRRGLEERAEVEFARSRRDETPIGMIVADLDDFKTINDSLGHPAGDQVLRRVAEVLERETRAFDAVARIGGDEFAVLLPGANATAALRIAERLRVSVRRSASEAHLRLSLSIGVAIGPDSGETLEQLWLAADRAMYEAKRSSGDAVAAAPDPAHTMG